MTDVMTVGIYPDEPLPGPIDGDFAWVDGVKPSPFPGVFLHDGVHLVEREWPPRDWPRINPILDPPMYFPGNAWKGTSGMPQRADPVVYA
jgi:hypothetical protein